jgi:hypothetical protein
MTGSPPTDRRGRPQFRVGDAAPRVMVALHRAGVMAVRVKLVKQQINGAELVVLKTNASPEDLEVEAERLKTMLGYQVQRDKRRGGYLASHRFYQGKFVLKLAPD